MSDFKVLFIHGYTASSRADFYPSLTPQLDKYGIDYVIPDLPGDRHPHADEWLETLHQAIISNEKPLVIVGHSLGTRTALLYIEKYRPKVMSLFLFAAFANRLENASRRGGDAYPDFFNHLVDIQTVTKQIEKAYVIHSLDDSSIAYEQGVEIAKDLHAELITEKERDHFSSPKNAPYIFSLMKEKLGFI